MDNVDKMELANQLDAFQLSLWFMSRTGAFIILQMRDETYERYKNQPPLDTFRSGIAFHIAPPHSLMLSNAVLNWASNIWGERLPTGRSIYLRMASASCSPRVSWEIFYAHYTQSFSGDGST